MQETQVQSLGREDLLEKQMATHSSILAWKVPWTEEFGGLQSLGSQRVRHDLATIANKRDGRYLQFILAAVFQSPSSRDGDSGHRV